MQANLLNDIINNNMLQRAFAMRDNLIAVAPVPQKLIDDGHRAMHALVLIGFLTGEPVYRTTHAVTHRKHGFLKLENLLEKYVSCRYGRNRCFPHPLATMVS